MTAPARTIRRGSGPALLRAWRLKQSFTKRATVKESVCRVIGDGALHAEQVLAGLKRIGVKLRSATPLEYVLHVLSGNPEIFPRTEIEGRRAYRAAPRKIDGADDGPSPALAARELGVPSERYRRWENGECVPLMADALMIEKRCGVPMGAWVR